MTSRSKIAEVVEKLAGRRCEYYRMHQSLQGATFHVEHVVPRSLGGTSGIHNLAWACPTCNLHKSDRVEVQLPGAPQANPLFNPRTDKWDEDFAWDGYRVLGRTPLGQAAIDVLQLNHRRRIKIRQAEALFGLFPPDDDKPSG